MRIHQPGLPGGVPHLQRLRHIKVQLTINKPHITQDGRHDYSCLFSVNHRLTRSDNGEVQLRKGLFYLLCRGFMVRQIALEKLLIGGDVKMTVAAEIEKNRL